MPRPRTVLTAAVWLVVWAGLTALLGTALFLQSSRPVVVASHDAVLTPTLDGWVEVQTGPILPDLRVRSGSTVGADIRLGKTDARSLDQLAQRYAVIAAQPGGQVAKVRGVLVDLALLSAVRGAGLAALPFLVWLLLGSRRRGELVHGLRRPVVAGIALVVAAALVLALRPWAVDDPTTDEDRAWITLQDFLGSGVPLPAGLPPVWVRGDLTTTEAQRLVQSAVSTYDRSKTWYHAAAEEAATLDLHEAGPEETVVALVSDRHDNIGMDPVARAVADRAGATAVLDAGDDTSAGKTWEAFSLDSVTEAFEDLPRWAVAGNHDHGAFVPAYLARHGWSMLDGEVVDGPGDSRLLGVDDPRSSGLGNWRDEPGLTFTEVGDRLADAACDATDRVTTVLVHDAALGRQVLERGCADLVVGGHLHVRVGPTRVVGENGRVGYSFTTGTTGGAAYAIALGSKPRRDAMVSLLTYRRGRPVGIQSVLLRTDQQFVVSAYDELTYSEPAVSDARDLGKVTREGPRSPTPSPRGP